MISCLLIIDLRVVVRSFWLQPSVVLANAEGSKGAIRSEDEASLFLGISWALSDFCEDTIWVIVVKVLFPEVCILLDGDSYLLSSVTISIEEICNEIVLMLDRAILSLESVVLSPSSNSAIGSSRIWDRKFASPCVESFFFDSCIVSSPPLTVDFLFVLFGPILCLICSIVISPHCLHILIGSLFNFS